jgi:hypothetical protein
MTEAFERFGSTTVKFDLVENGSSSGVAIRVPPTRIELVQAV